LGQKPTRRCPEKQAGQGVPYSGTGEMFRERTKEQVAVGGRKKAKWEGVKVELMRSTDPG